MIDLRAGGVALIALSGIYICVFAAYWGYKFINGLRRSFAAVVSAFAADSMPQLLDALDVTATAQAFLLKMLRAATWTMSIGALLVALS